MQVYKTSLLKKVTNIFWYAIGVVFLCYIIHLFTDNVLYIVGVPLVIAGYPVYSTLFSDDIRFEITDDNSLVIKRRGKVRHVFRCDEIEVNFKFVTGTNDDYRLFITDLNDSKEYSFDCELLSKGTFKELLMALEAYNPDKPIKIN